MTLKDIVLRKLDSILNPNFINKFIFSIFSLGFFCISYQKILSLCLSIEVITNEFYTKFIFENDFNIGIVIFGIFLIIISIYLFIKRNDILENSDKAKIDNILNILNTSKNKIDITHTDEEIKIFLLKNENLIQKSNINNFIRLFKELSLNSKIHGNANEILIEKTGNKIIFKDDSLIEFNPLNFIENNTINKQGGMLTLEYIVRNISNVSINYSRENNVNLLTFEFLESFIDKNTEKCILDVSYELNTYNYDAKNKFIIDSKIKAIQDNNCTEITINLIDSQMCISSIKTVFPVIFRNLYEKELKIKICISKNDTLIFDLFEMLLENEIKQYKVEVFYI